MSEDDKKLKEGIELILKSDNNKDIDRGVAIIDEVLFKNDKLNILKHYIHFTKNVDAIKNKEIGQSDPDLKYNIYSIADLNILLNRINE